MTKTEAEALALLREALPFLDGGSDCLVCGEPPGAPHEKDCFVPRIEKLVDRKLWFDDGRQPKCEHKDGKLCDSCRNVEVPR